MHLKRFLCGLMSAVGLLAAGEAAAEYPERPVTLVIGYPAGGGTDIQSRVLVPFLEKYLGTSVIVENREGAGGLIGATYIAKSKPDGYTIGALNFPSMYSPIVQGNATYKADAFTPLANQIGGDLALTVNKASPIRSAKEFVEAAKANPVVVGVTGVGHPSQITALLFEEAAGVKLNFVPFNGGGPARLAMLGNHVTLGFMNLNEVFADHRSGALRVLATSGNERSPLSPDVPTFKEAGYNVQFSLLAGFGAPAGLPANVEARLVDAFQKALNDPDYIAEARKRELTMLPLTQAEFAEALKKGNVDLAELWKSKPWTK
ncbi:tripartite tricarboxylate transporter substrate binding protein [Rhizobium puerariae]|uniref:Tripartite tricarboxylate transporter substrate binding protein n=1 Tax=Rhizobium puerariae TaxID=1585791 RepID=A0ABV6AH90_9HYPH